MPDRYDALKLENQLCFPLYACAKEIVKMDYALFVEGTLVGVVEAKKDEMGENLSAVESQSGRYANSVFRHVPGRPHIRFLYEATGELTYFTDCDDLKPCSRRVFSFHRPETRRFLLSVYRLKSSRIPEDVQVCISTIQRMYSILRGEELDESAEEESMFEQPEAEKIMQQAEVMRQSYLKTSI